MLKDLINEIHERKARTETEYNEVQASINILKEKIDIAEITGDDAGAMLEELKRLEELNIDRERKYKAITKQDINALINQNPNIKAEAEKMFNIAMACKSELQKDYERELLELNTLRDNYIKQLKTLFMLEKQAEQQANDLNYSKEYINKKDMIYIGISGSSDLYNEMTGQGRAIIGSGEISAIKAEI